MRVLLTGASSFTGFHFAKRLAAAGHEVHATFTRDAAQAYDGLYRQRIDALPAEISRVFSAPMGSGALLTALRSGPWDIVGLHGASVFGYKSPSFDAIAAVATNTCGIGPLFDQLGLCAGQVIATGSYFEADEGGPEGTEALSAYGLSKTLTYQIYRYHAQRVGLPIAKFVIPNPFGCYERFNFCSFLASRWLSGEVAEVQDVECVWDYIDVDLLALAYVRFAEDLCAAQPTSHRHSSFAPSAHAESQWCFASRVAREMQWRLGVRCELAVGRCAERRVERYNREPVVVEDLVWRADHAWDRLAEYYLARFKPRLVATPAPTICAR